MFQDIMVMSKAMARRMSYKIRDSSEKTKYAILSITNVGDALNSFAKTHKIVGILQVQFDDVGGEKLNAMLQCDAKKILNFMEGIKDRADVVIVHCEAGISRSAGVRSTAGSVPRCRKKDFWQSSILSKYALLSNDDG